MVLSFHQFVESKADHSELHKFARHEYSNVAADLPDWSHGHHDSAHDHVADRMFEKFHTSHPHANFRSITKKALKGYVDDDRKDTRAREKKQDRAYAARNRPAKQPKVKKVKEAVPYWKKAGYSHDIGAKKPKRGIGSS